MSLGLADIVDAALSHAQSSGWFEQVSGHEPKNRPSNGLSAALWLDEVFPYRRRSGLSSTSACVVLQVRVAMPMLHEPQDEIDPLVMTAVDSIMEAYSGDFTLGGLIANVDLLGETGQSMRMKAGYLNHDGTLFRVATVTLPLVVNDLWVQAP